MTKVFPRGLVAGLAVAAALSMPAAVRSATQGSLGPTSTGTLNINVAIPNHVRISQLDDINLGTWDGVTDPLAGFDDLCVYSSTRAYKLTASGSGAASAFTVSDGGTNTIAYSVTWRDENNVSQALTTGVQVSNIPANHNSVTCNGGGNNNARVTVSMTAANLGAAVAGTYTGVLTLTVAPE